MMHLTPGKIFLADQRGLTETTISRRFSTFNFEKYYDEDKQPFGDLFICNDESLVGGKLSFFLSREDSYQLFFPTTGRLDIVQGGKAFSVNTGEVQVLNVGKGEVLEISNPNSHDTINYIQIGIKTDMFLLRASEMLFSFDFETCTNQLTEVISHPKLPFKLSAGIFAESAETTYKLQNKAQKIFCLVVDGTFEIEGRKLHARDGLALWDLEKVKLEALSNNAMVLVVVFS